MCKTVQNLYSFYKKSAIKDTFSEGIKRNRDFTQSSNNFPKKIPALEWLKDD